MAGVRQHLAQRRGAYLRRELVLTFGAGKLERRRADGNHLRDRHARPQARFHVGRLALPRRAQGRAAVPEDCSVQPLHRRERGPHRASGRRGRARGRVPQVGVRPEETASGSTSPTPTTTSSSTATRIGATTACPACRRTTVRAEVLYKHPNGFYAGPNVEWMPQAFFADNANSLTVDPYALLNFKIGYDRGTGWSGYLEGRNLFDKRYISTTITAEIATASSALFNPGIGRAVYRRRALPDVRSKHGKSNLCPVDALWASAGAAGPDEDAIRRLLRSTFDQPVATP